MKRLSSIVLLAGALLLFALYISGGLVFSREPASVAIEIGAGDITILQQGGGFLIEQEGRQSGVYRRKPLIIEGGGRLTNSRILVKGAGSAEEPLQITLRDVRIAPPAGDAYFSALTLEDTACVALSYEGENRLGSGIYRAGLTWSKDAVLLLADADRPGQFLPAAAMGLAPGGEEALSFEERELAYIKTLGLSALLEDRKAGGEKRPGGADRILNGGGGRLIFGGAAGGGAAGSGAGGGRILLPDAAAAGAAASAGLPLYAGSGAVAGSPAAGLALLPGGAAVGGTAVYTGGDTPAAGRLFWSAVLPDAGNGWTLPAAGNGSLAAADPPAAEGGADGGRSGTPAAIAAEKLQLVIAGLTSSLTVSLPQASSQTVGAPADDIITRAVLITVLYELTTDVTVRATRASHRFSDVAAGVWYEKPVLWAKEKELIQGVSRTLFAPERGVTRQEMARILNQYLYLVGEHPGRAYALPAFSDKDRISAWARDAVAVICGLNIMKEKTGGRFAPAAYVTKEEFRDVLVRFAQL